MRVVGIIAEYNPLHNGHIYHMEESKKQAGSEFCVVAMSGNFVQRGEPACTDKFTRAAWAARTSWLRSRPCLLFRARNALRKAR